MNKDLTWRILKAMNNLYMKGKIPSGKTKDSHVRYLINRKLIGLQHGNSNYLVAFERYKRYYKKNYLEDFEQYETFLHGIDDEIDGRRNFTVRDIQTLMFIQEQREELIKHITTRRTFSGQIFKYGGSKYLENRPGLDRIVCKILDIDNFPSEDPRDLQWRFVVDCPNPKLVVLCENLDFLKTPQMARKHNIELWYVGGNNTSIINHIGDDKLIKPLFYSCDWDYDGLRIFCRIKDILNSKSKDISLLYPSNLQNALPVDSPHHKSKWNDSLELSGLNKAYFKKHEIELLNKLIRKNQWIEEESNDLLGMLNFNKVLGQTLT